MFCTDNVRMMNSPWGFTIMYGLLGSPACAARVMLSTRNSNFPSRTGDPAGAAVGVTWDAGAGAAARLVAARLELDEELDEPDDLSSLPAHLPIAKSSTRMPTTINATLPPLEGFFVATGA